MNVLAISSPSLAARQTMLLSTPTNESIRCPDEDVVGTVVYMCEWKQEIR